METHNASHHLVLTPDGTAIQLCMPIQKGEHSGTDRALKRANRLPRRLPPDTSARDSEPENAISMFLSAFSSPFKRRPSGRRGVVTLELILWLPILIIFLLAIVEFALIMQFNQQVSYASRFGAKLAAEVSRLDADTPNLSDYVSGGTLQNEIDVYLANHGISASCEVQLEHNACVANTSQTDTAVACRCGASPTTLPAGEPPAGEAYVKVTVCVRLTGNVPNVLSTFGFDLNGADGTAGNADDPTIEHSTVFRVETANTTALPTITATSVNGLDGGDTENTPITNGNVVITISGGTPNPGDTLDINLTGAATDPEDGAFAAGALNWTVTSTNPPANGTLASATGASNTLTVIVPADGGGSQIHTLRLSTTDSCNATAFREITVTVTNNNP